MLIDIVNNQDKVIGRKEKHVARKAGDIFRVVHVFVRNEEGKILLQKIGAGNAYCQAGWWGSSAAGYVAAGEAYDIAVKRKLQEELAIGIGKYSAGTTHYYQAKGTRKFIGLFIYDIANETVTHDMTHVASVRWVTTDQIRKEIANDSGIFSPTFLFLWQQWMKEIETSS